jgi:hypothetical protein
MDEISSVSMHSTEDLVEELMKRSVAGYIALWAYDSQSGECYSVEETKGDERLLRGVMQDACEGQFADMYDEGYDEE